MKIKNKKQYEILKKYLTKINSAQNLLKDFNATELDELEELDSIALFRAMFDISAEVESLKRSLNNAIERWEHQQTLQPVKK